MRTASRPEAPALPVPGGGRDSGPVRRRRPRPLSLCLPTGTGKTIVFTEIARRVVERGGRALVLAHRDELLAQAADEAAGGRHRARPREARPSAPEPPLVVVASVQTLRGGRLASWPADTFRMVVDGRSAPRDRRQLPRHPRPLRLARASSAALRRPTGSIAPRWARSSNRSPSSYELRDAIRDGWLCPHRCAPRAPRRGPRPRYTRVLATSTRASSRRSYGTARRRCARWSNRSSSWPASGARSSSPSLSRTPSSWPPPSTSASLAPRGPHPATRRANERREVVEAFPPGRAPHAGQLPALHRGLRRARGGVHRDREADEEPRALRADGRPRHPARGRARSRSS